MKDGADKLAKNDFTNKRKRGTKLNFIRLNCIYNYK